MQVVITRVHKSDKTVLRNLMEYYCYDFSEFLDFDVNDHGTFGYPYLDLYWLEPGRVPYFIKVDGKYAGFALICKHFKVLREPTGNSIAEFFVLRKYRRKGIASQAIRLVLRAHPGPWEVSVVMKNIPASTFWNKTVDEYAKGDFQKVVKVEKGLQREIFIFDSQNK